ncbi:MAG: biotin/lipoyl-binding protein [Anaerolineae bacterium]|nr:biotin/lipoyl-binding protein [Anaerolineae bacterium]
MSNLRVTIDGHAYDINLNLPAVNGAGFEVIVNGETVRVQLPDISQSGREMEWLIVDERPYEIVLDPDLTWIKAFSGIHRLEIKDLDATTSRPRSGDGRIKAPIPGLITAIRVQVGDVVQVGQPILVLEAMKMENEIRAPLRGVVTAVHVQPGQTVAGSAVLVEIGNP